jgi:hypothetical protein
MFKMIVWAFIILMIALAWAAVGAIAESTVLPSARRKGYTGFVL